MGGMVYGPRTALKAFVIWTVILLLLVGGMVYVAQGVIAEEDALEELDNESIEVDNATDLIYVDIETTENATNESVAEVEIEDDDGELALDDEIALEEDALVTTEYNVSEEEIENGNYTVYVFGDDDEIDEISIGTTDESSGGVAIGGQEFEKSNLAAAGIGVVLIALFGVVLARGTE